MTMSLSRPAHSPHLYLVNWPGTASAKVLMTNNLPSPVGPGMLADPGPEGSLSSLVLVRPPRACCLIFGPESLTMDSSYILNLFTKLLYNNTVIYILSETFLSVNIKHGSLAQTLLKATSDYTKETDVSNPIS